MTNENRQIQKASEIPTMIDELAKSQGLDATRYWQTVKQTLVPSGQNNVTNEQIYAVLAVARQYNLNPLTKQIYAFPTRGGGVQPIVSVDGWLQIANSHTQFDGLDTEEIREGGDVIAVTCRIHRKDRGHPTVATEYMDECRRNTEPWKQWPVRMLTNKAMIQAIRRAFSLAGIVDPDEGERIQAAEVVSVETAEPAPADRAATRTEDIKNTLADAQPADGEITTDEMEGETDAA